MEAMGTEASEAPERRRPVFRVTFRALLREALRAVLRVFLRDRGIEILR